MLTIRLKARAVRLVEALASSSLLIMLLVGSDACTPCAHDIRVLYVYGKILDSQTSEGATDAAVGGRTFTDGEQTDYVGPFIYDGSPTFPPPQEDGTFEVAFTRRSQFCQDFVTEFPPPDRIEIIVVRGDCEQTFSIDINEGTVVDLDFPGDVLELNDPILVGPCTE